MANQLQRWSEVIKAFHGLGWTSFGGPVAHIAFVLPSAVIMLALGLGVEHVAGLNGAGWLHGRKIVVVGVVARAVVSMSRRLCPDWPHRLIAAC